ncbi:MAG TPA: (Fe-S)-binding protein, partial [Spirochaetota bacterium]|nr:(Fe-S)-binding protein [Spirochaetota bacterium]
MAEKYRPEDLAIPEAMPGSGWMDMPAPMRRGFFSHAASPKHAGYLGLPNPREWQPHDEDWKLPPDWRNIILDGMRERLKRSRSFRLFMETCARCGACADKCHFFLGTGDPRNMPVLRAELLRSVYRGEFTLAGKIFGKLIGARRLTEKIIKEWFYYF